jgi:hypothetical protein
MAYHCVGAQLVYANRTADVRWRTQRQKGLHTLAMAHLYFIYNFDKYLLY